MKTPEEIEGKKVLFHCKMNPEDWGLTKSEAAFDDMAEEYAVVKIEPQYAAGIMVYGKYNGILIANPWTSRHLIRVLLNKLNILHLNPK